MVPTAPVGAVIDAHLALAVAVRAWRGGGDRRWHAGGACLAGRAEYGIPAVVATGDATVRLMGQTVTVDGSAGVAESS